MTMNGMSAPMTNDDSCEKNHASSVFEMMRQMVPCKSNGSIPLDIALYHSEDLMCFDCGDTGLSRCELSIPPCSQPDSGPKGKRMSAAMPMKQKDSFNLEVTKLAGCAGGGVVVG